MLFAVLGLIMAARSTSHPSTASLCDMTGAFPPIVKWDSLRLSVAVDIRELKKSLLFENRLHKISNNTIIVRC